MAKGEVGRIRVKRQNHGQRGDVRFHGEKEARPHLPAAAITRSPDKVQQQHATNEKPQTQPSAAKEKRTEDINSIQSDVASFAASLGLGGPGLGLAGASVGFNDKDFRTPGKKIGQHKDDGSKKKGQAHEPEPKQPGNKKEANRKVRWDDENKRQTGNNWGGGKDGSKGDAFQHKRWEMTESDHRQEKYEKGEGNTKKNVLDFVSKGPRGSRSGADSSVFWGATSLESGRWYEAAMAAVNKIADDGGPAGEKGGNAEGDKIGKTLSGDGISGKKGVGKGGKASLTRYTAEDPEMEELLRQKEGAGAELLGKAEAAYHHSKMRDSDARWLETARRSGTSSDRVAAMTITIQDNALANGRSLDALLGMVESKGGKRQAAIAMEAVKELLITSLLPDRKLKRLSQQPIASIPSGKDGERVLLFWYWEDLLKQRYERFVGALDAASRDNLPFFKDKALKTVYDLLVAKPEQEARLLSILVNKLGDPERKMASKAGYLLSSLVTAHPNMKRVVVQEVDNFVFRPHVGPRARYYAAVFLNQIVLSHKGDGPLLAKNLINVYFALFKTVTCKEEEDAKTVVYSKKGVPKVKTRREAKTDEGDKRVELVEADSRILSALLTGVNRAFPYVATDDADMLIEQHTPSLFLMVHASSFNLAVQALMLIYQLMASRQAVSQRFYRALYGALLSPSLANSSKVGMFLSILFKAMRNDLDSKRIAAFCKRLLQVALQCPPAFACGSLMLVSEVVKARPSLWSALLQGEDHDDEAEHFVDAPDVDVAPAEQAEEGNGEKKKKKKKKEKKIGGAKAEEERDEDGEELEGARIDVGSDDPGSEDEDPRQRRQNVTRAGSHAHASTSEGAGAVEGRNGWSTGGWRFGRREPEVWERGRLGPGSARGTTIPGHVSRRIVRQRLQRGGS